MRMYLFIFLLLSLAYSRRSSNLVRTETSPSFEIYLHNFKYDSWLSKTIFNTGRLDVSEENVIKSVIDNLSATYANVYVLDIGANIGYISMFMASISENVKIEAFEPYDTHRKLFTKSVKKNNFGNRINIHSMLLGNETTYKCMQSNPTNAASTEIVHSNCKEKIRMYKLDDIFPHTPLFHFIKMDVEGYEPFVVQGAKMLLSKYPNYILMEWIPWRMHKHYPGFDAVKFVNEFSPHYFIKIIENPSAHALEELPQWKRLYPDGCNLLFSRKN